MQVNNFVDVASIKPNKFSGITNDSLKTKDSKALRDVCNSFEAFFMNQILETSLKDTNVAGSGTGSKIIQGMYTDALSQNSSGNLGISDMLYRFLSENRS